MRHLPDCRHECAASDAEGTMSRRRLLVGAAAGAGLLATWSVGHAVAAVEPSLDDSASAVNPAARMGNETFVSTTTTTTATTTTTTTTIPAPPVGPPGEGEILFPLALGSEWTAYILENYGDTRGRCCGYYHQGVDIMADEGTPQVAVVDGELTKRYENSFWGWTLTGDDGVIYKYFHSAEDANGWEVGDRVQQGDIIGFVSDSGTSSGNFHLHFEYRPSNVPANPYAKLQRIPGANFQT
ncbi:MAG: M23 family metallopeptidase [Ilumatobacter sp.]|uniref:M23 family metallopeptidase n=1 Tax=Ilumatobacter sp. TaxID=1967498 RepID=UPI003C75890B